MWSVQRGSHRRLAPPGFWWVLLDFWRIGGFRTRRCRPHGWIGKLWFGRWHKVVSQVSCPINRSTDWLVIRGARFPALWIMPAMSSGVQEGSSFPLVWTFVRRVVSVARPSIDSHWASMGSAAVPWAGMFKMEISAVLDPIGCLQCPVLGPSIGTTPFGGLVILAITLPWVVLEVVLVDALGLASFLPLVLTLSFAFGISWCLQLLEEHPLIDLPGPEKLVFFDGLHGSLQGGAVCHELIDLPPGIPLRPQECELRRWRSASCDGWPIEPIIPFIQVWLGDVKLLKLGESQCAHQEVVPKDSVHALQLAPGLGVGSLLFFLLFLKTTHCELAVTLGWPFPLLPARAERL